MSTLTPMLPFWGSLPETGCGGGPFEHPLLYGEDLWETEAYSDFKVRLSTGQEIGCHRSVVCAQCPFFRQALIPGRFKEGYTQIVSMPHDPPHAVKALLEYMYRGGYSVNESALDAPHTLLQHLDVLTIASIYDVPKLGELAQLWLARTIKHHFLTAALPVLPELLSTTTVLPPIKKDAAVRRFAYALRWHLGAHMRVLVADDGVWAGMWRHARDFMRGRTCFMVCCWRERRGDLGLAEAWLTRFLGAETARRALRVVKCPKERCGVENGLVFTERLPGKNRCYRCGWTSELVGGWILEEDRGVLSPEMAAWLQGPEL
ncbi:hypothetical protein DIS24_g11450 [Lasiodiplodia hormozganensis]|uniref:BTB domain-containing protein n=1 Tax=Lasiodiplodia hormozganensis TaxID=869390 RepID=A0AA39WT24_9PEZI|nr:hypothetical protein DIS24_g11450 [Lasiodiplodia hormozganensis]